MLLPATHHMDLSANAHLVFLVLRVNMTPKPVALFTAIMEEPVYLAIRVQNVCALQHLLDQNANSLLTVPVLQTHATMVAHARTQQRRHITIVSALPISLVNDVTSWTMVHKKKSVKSLNVKS